MQLETSATEQGGRGSRIRKAKVVFDPSNEQAAKRRATIGNIEPEAKSKPTPPKTTESKKEINGRRSLELPIKAIDTNRRNTITEFDNGCIVCSRSDVKKGRFVYCIQCSTRGHFTCLRNGKLLSSSDDEPTWQCASCQTCNICYKVTEDRLYKCIICANSYHLTCQKRKPTHVKKKNFKCENCCEMESLQMKRRPDNGFAGFSEEDATAGGLNTSATSMGKREQNGSALVDPLDISNEIKILSDTSSPVSEPISCDTRRNSLSTDDIDMKTRSHFETNVLDAKEALMRLELKQDDKDIVKVRENIPDVQKWDCDEIFTYFMGTTTAEYAHIFKDKAIDGDALLLITREDVLTKFDLKLGPALRLYSHILTLQFKNNNPVLGWDED